MVVIDELKKKIYFVILNVVFGFVAVIKRLSLISVATQKLRKKNYFINKIFSTAKVLIIMHVKLVYLYIQSRK